GLAMRTLRKRAAARGDGGSFPSGDNWDHDAGFYDLVSGLYHPCHYLYPSRDRRGLSVHAEGNPANFRIPGVLQTRRIDQGPWRRSAGEEPRRDQLRPKGGAQLHRRIRGGASALLPAPLTLLS